MPQIEASVQIVEEYALGEHGSESWWCLRFIAWCFAVIHSAHPDLRAREFLNENEHDLEFPRRLRWLIQPWHLREPLGHVRGSTGP
jgi:hypothetical protein